MSIKNSSFWRNNAIFFSATFVVSIVNYLFYPVLSRLLDVTQFGDVQALISLFTQFTIIVTSISSTIIHYVSNNRRLDYALIRTFEQIVLGLTVLLSAIALLASTSIVDSLKLADATSFYLFLGACIITAPLIIRRGVMQGAASFGRVSIATFISALGRLILAVILVVIGLATAGVLFGVLLAQIIAFFYVRSNTSSALHYTGKPELHRVRAMKPILQFALITSVVSYVVTILYSFDIVVIKYLFSPEEAGTYAGVAAIARSIFFLCAPLVAVQFVSVKQEQTKAHNQGLFVRTLGLVSLIGIGGVVGSWLFDDIVIRLLIGSEYLPAAQHLVSLAWLMLLVSVMNVVSFYRLALRDFSVVAFLLAALITSVIRIATSHDTITDVVNGFIFGSIVGIGLMAIWYSLKGLRNAQN